MEIKSTNRAGRIVNIISSHEHGIFVGDATNESPTARAANRVVELHIPFTRDFVSDFDAIEAGDKDVLAKYLIPDEDIPSRYTFARNCFGWMNDLHSSTRVVDALVEYVPFAENTEHLEVI